MENNTKCDGCEKPVYSVELETVRLRYCFSCALKYQSGSWCVTYPDKKEEE